MYDDLDDYYDNDDVDYNVVGVVHYVGLMIMMMKITMMHFSHSTIYHYHNNYHLLLFFIYIIFMILCFLILFSYLISSLLL